MSRNKMQIVSLEKEFKKFDRELSSIKDLNKDVHEEMINLSKKKELLEAQVKIEQEALDQMQKQVDKTKDTYNDELKTRGTMEIEIKSKKNEIFKMDEEFIILESKGKKLQNKVKGYQIESIKLNKQIKILQKQQEKYGIEASTAHARYYQTVEELKIKNNIIAELQKKNLELESKLKH